MEDRDEGEKAKQRSVEEWSSAPEIHVLFAGIAKRYGLSATDGEDILQETLIVLLRAGPDVQVCRSWILKVASRKAIDLVRNDEAMSNLEDTYARARRIADAETRETRHLLRARADRLPPRLSSIWELRYVRGLTQREAAAELEIGRSSLRRLEQQFRRAITKRPPPRPGNAPGTFELVGQTSR